MSERMWSLSQFRYDEGIDADEVDVLLDELEPMARDDAIAYAHERGGNLVASWPTTRAWRTTRTTSAARRRT